jgi:hypothetical protein
MCDCLPTTCAAEGKNCGSIPDGCNGMLDCGTCTGTEPICVNNVCQACSTTDPCTAGCCASDGSCQPGDADSACGSTGQLCDVCEVIEACASGSCVPRPCGQGGVCLVFATSTTHDGNLGGLDGADAICKGRAAAANLPGTYKAWLSDDTGSPSTRFVQSTGPYRRVDGETIANNWTDLTDGDLLAQITRTEHNGGATANPPFIWTDTTTSGEMITNVNDCENWTSNADMSIGGYRGRTDSGGAAWTVALTASCRLPARLYCFQQS